LNYNNLTLHYKFDSRILSNFGFTANGEFGSGMANISKHTAKNFRERIAGRLTPGQVAVAISIFRFARRIFDRAAYRYALYVSTPIRLRRNNGKKDRKLEIGPGARRVIGFETVNVVQGHEVDYVADATRPLPFANETFDVVFASHILEHTPWFALEATLSEWSRVLKRNGQLEVWVPDGYKLCKFITDIEDGINRTEWSDEWRPFNTENNPFKWANGRLLYGTRKDYPSWHTAIITPNYLKQLFSGVGLINVSIMPECETRGVKHGWINLGVRGTKP